MILDRALTLTKQVSSNLHSKALRLKQDIFKRLMQTHERLLLLFNNCKLKTISAIHKMKLDTTRWYNVKVATAWHHIHWTKHKANYFWKNHKGGLGLLSFLLLFDVTLYAAWFNEHQLILLFENANIIGNIRSLLLTLGVGLVGVVGIAFTFIMFAMQVNIERMPHGLFHKFSTDSQLIFNFLFLIVLAITIAILSVFIDPFHVLYACAASFWLVVAVFLLLISCYNRALFLINPMNQLNILYKDIRKLAKKTETMINRAVPLLKSDEQAAFANTQHDLPRMAYFQMYPNWWALAERHTDHIISFYRKSSERKDYEVSRGALDTIVAINALYIGIKGKTFFADVPLFCETPFSSDPFINKTLEHLRQNMSFALPHGDEEQMLMVMQTYSKLVSIYCLIDYANAQSQKQHPLLAAYYLGDAVKSLLSRKVPDVAMKGIRLLGTSSINILNAGGANDIDAIINDIGAISLTAVLNERNRIAVQIGTEQLSIITTKLILKTNSNNAKYTLNNIKSHIRSVANLVLEIPNVPTTIRFHSIHLTSFYSGISKDTLLSWFTQLSNDLLNKEANDENAKLTIRNVVAWADQLYIGERKLLTKAIEKRSLFAQELFHWSMHMTKVLLAVSKSQACDNYSKEKLIENALNLLNNVHYLPNEAADIRFTGVLNIPDELFDIAMQARQWSSFDVAGKIGDLLLSWAFKVGARGGGLALFEQSIYGLVYLALTNRFSNSILALQNKIRTKIVEDNDITPEHREAIASNIRNEAGTAPRGYAHSSIDRAMYSVDNQRLANALNSIADIIDNTEPTGS